jgi:hypothetical protein
MRVILRRVATLAPRPGRSAAIQRQVAGRGVIQPLILTIYRPGVQIDGLLDLEIDVLSTGYGDQRTVTMNDTTIAATKGLGAKSSSEILVVNAHGSNATVAGRTVEQFAQLLTNAGATGYKEIHLYACQAGMSLYDFDKQLSDLTKTPVWAPRGNTRYNSKRQEYGVRKMTFDANQNKWVPKGEQEYVLNEGWWYSKNGVTTGRGKPPVPNAFPPPPPEVDLSLYQFVVEESGFGNL